MKDLIVMFLFLVFIIGALNIIYIIGDWLCSFLSPFAIYVIIVGSFSAVVYFIYKKEVE